MTPNHLNVTPNWILLNLVTPNHILLVYQFHVIWKVEGQQKLVVNDAD